MKNKRSKNLNFLAKMYFIMYLKKKKKRKKEKANLAVYTRYMKR